MGAPSDAFRGAIEELDGEEVDVGGDSTELGLLTMAPPPPLLLAVVVVVEDRAFCKARTSAAVPEIIGAEDDVACCLKLHILARSAIVDPMELSLDVTVSVEVDVDVP